jgi:hypothetical protein
MRQHHFLCGKVSDSYFCLRIFFVEFQKYRTARYRPESSEGM